MLTFQKDKQFHFKKKYTFNDSRLAKNGSFRIAFEQSGSPKSQLYDWLHSCDARNEASRTDQVERVNALTPTVTYSIQAALTQSQAEGNKKAKFN